MRTRTRGPLITLGTALVLLTPVAPASAATLPGDLDIGIEIGQDGKFLDISLTLGQRRQLVVDLAKEYLVARDEGWKTPEGPGPAMAAIETEGAEVGEQPAAFARGPATWAAEAEAEEGLLATGVDTGFFDGEDVTFDGDTATVTLTSGTALAWNDSTLGESSLSDTYIVELVREGRTWTITEVSYAPVESTAAPTDDAESEAADDGIGLLAAHSYDRQAAAEYALEWSNFKSDRFGNHVWEARNPDYEDLGSTNCANFVSQALYAGGWTKNEGVNPKDPENWDDNLTGWGIGASRTWVNANWLYDFTVEHAKRGYWQNMWPPSDPTTGPGSPDFAIWELEPGDLIFTDWDDDNPDGTMDHTMIVTGSYTDNQGFTEPTYSQNSPNRHNLPLSVGMKMAHVGMVDDQGEPRTIVYTPVKLYDTFED
ncbi:amidase domain-containing protein [Streptomyces jeddahensis]|uniref:Putative amidase domain protein n=1 Tax=Streptomyces jeddahensis TaxID=1716141 RepID=A0A177HLW6_9ACTN|nr:amidase domain-containing protein [Streptomyces jeddahensis]OAH11580.1 putative amidase domain protein [Streptomyces jeddahensis]